MTQIQPQLWVDRASEAVAFYEAAFGATVLHRVGAGDDIVAQLAVGEAVFWVAPSSASLKRLSPRAIDGTTSRTLLVVEDHWPQGGLGSAVLEGLASTGNPLPKVKLLGVTKLPGSGTRLWWPMQFQ